MMLEELKAIKNKTLPYLFPLITSKTSKLSDYKDDESFPKCNFINVFRHSELHPDLDKHLFVVYKFSPNPQFDAFMTRLRRNRNFHSMEDLDKYSVVLIFEVPSECQKTLDHFDKGEFSKFKNDDKAKILTFYSVSSQDKFGPAGVLYKKEWRRLEIESKIGMSLPADAELSSIPDLKLETYFKKYLENDEGDIG
jgi:hypothetical protein